MKYLIIGGAGFIGSNLADYLAKNKNQVVVLDNLSRKGAEKNLDWLLSNYHQRIRFVKADIRCDSKVLNREVSWADVVFHLGAQVAVTTSVENPREDFEINALGSFNVLESARKTKNPPILIYSSTNKVYGGMDDIKVVEKKNRYEYANLPYGVSEEQPLDFHSPYGCSKGTGDQYFRDYARIYNLPTIVFRQSCIYGPRQFGVEDQGWIAWFIIAVILGKPITIYGNGKQVRDVLYIDDLINAYLLAIKNIKKTRGQIYNIGGGMKFSMAIWEEFAPILEKLLGREIKVSYSNWRPGDQPIYISDIRKARRDFGWQPKFDHKEGIRKLFGWVKNNKELFKDFEMRIAVLHRYPASQIVGTNASFPSFLKELKNRGHKVFYLTYKSPQKEKQIPGVSYRELPLYFFRGDRKDKLIKTILWIFLAPLKSWRIKKKDKIEVFYCDDSVPYYGFLTKLLVGKTKVIIRLGDLQSGYKFADQGFLKGILFKVSLFVERLMWQKVDGLVAISQSFAEFIEKQRLKRGKIKVVEESIDLEKFKERKNGVLRKKFSIKDYPLIIFHGALLSCKGLEAFIKATDLVLKKIPSAIFVIAGGGEEEERLKKLGTKLIRKKKLLFTGWYDHNELPGFLQDADIGVVMRSSNMANNFVVTTCILELWANGKPVIVPNLAAMRKVVKEGFNGMFFIPDDKDDLARKILYLINNKSLWRVLGENGRKTARKYFEKNLIGKKMVETLEEFMK